MEWRDWTTEPVVHDHITSAAGVVARNAAARFIESSEVILGIQGYVPLESPLEAIFWVWWNALAGANYPGEGQFRLAYQRDVACASKTYRLDFVVVLNDQREAASCAQAGLAFPNIAVEVDGHAFHEKTPEQVSKRNSRDRLLQQHGWTVFHFSWAELTSEPERCVLEVLNFAQTKYAECEVAIGQKWAADNPHKVTDVLKSIGVLRNDESL
jgi:hypothetical protein